ncbi:hypothetical protein SDC9_148553 [bioreactor metagenome]|uniref:Uncharacterized protein n=1 Tax=bioreactor metagenome TaxID=1076179 RepID=A0A645EKW9_9ZZZZ
MEARLRVTHRRGGIAVYRAKVSLTFDELVTHAEILREAGHRIVYRRVAVRVVLTHRFADDTRRFLEGLVMTHAKLHHREKYPSLHGFQSVARVGKGAPHDDAHRVIKITLLYLFFQRQRYNLIDFK